MACARRLRARLRTDQRHSHRHHQLVARRRTERTVCATTTSTSRRPGRSPQRRSRAPPHARRRWIDRRDVQRQGFSQLQPERAGSARERRRCVAAPFTDLVIGVGQHGCGYEASLEAAYRFLIDPEPYDTICRRHDLRRPRHSACSNGTDQALLQQRADFLRPDSLVSVVLVTDENDCSIIDGGQGFHALLPPEQRHRSAASSRAARRNASKTPTTACCFNCGVADAPRWVPVPRRATRNVSKGAALGRRRPDRISAASTRSSATAPTFSIRCSATSMASRSPRSPIDRREMVHNPLFADLTCTPGHAAAHRARQEPRFRDRDRRRPVAGHRRQSQRPDRRATRPPSSCAKRTSGRTSSATRRTPPAPCSRAIRT